MDHAIFQAGGEMKKRVISTLLAFFMIICSINFGQITDASAYDCVIEYVPSKTTVAPGEEFTITGRVSLYNSMDLYYLYLIENADTTGASGYNKSIFEVKSISGAGDNPKYDSEGYRTTYTPTITGSNNDLVTITVKVKDTAAAGNYKFSLTTSSAIGTNNYYLMQTWTPANITVSGASSSTTYTVSYDANGGTGAPDEQTKNAGSPLTLSGTRPTWYGHDFLGWATSATATTPEYQPQGTYADDASTTLYALWKVTTYKVTYNANGGTGAPDDDEKTFNQPYTIVGTVPTRTDYDFLGWATSATGAAIYHAGNIYETNAALALFAAWAEKTYAVNYDLNGALGSIDSVSGTYGTPITLPSVVPERTGYDFLGWSESSTATTPDYTPGASYSIPKKVTNFYAVWALKTYQITYDLNGAAGSIDPTAKTYGVDVALTQTVPEWDMHTFLGWSEDANATTATYSAGAAFTENKNTTLYAVWKDRVTVSYDLNGGLEGPDGSTVDAGSEYDIPGTIPKKEGHTFVGWTRTADSAVKEYDPGDSFSPEANTTLYAIWSVNSYTVTWLGADGSPLKVDTADYGTVPEYKGDTPVKANTAEFSYTFTGWDKEIVAVTGDVTYTAVFSETKNKYLVTWLGDGGVTLATAMVEYGTVPAYSGKIPTKAKTAEFTYTFAGWDKEVVAVTEAATYTATFTPSKNSYKIKWVNDTGKTLYSETVEYGKVPVYGGKTPTKTKTAEFSYTFAGWDKEVVAVTEATTYTATFSSSKNSYKVKWVNDAGKTLYSENVEYGKVPVYGGKTPTKAKTAEFTYTFAGWDKEIVAVTGAATYTATFTSSTNSYKIKWVNDTGKTLYSEMVEYGKVPVYGAETPAKKNTAEFTYTFKGWDKEIVPVTGAATYTAVFEATKNKYTAVFVTGNSAVMPAVTKEYGETIAVPGVLTKEGYNFMGWSLTDGGKVLAEGTEITIKKDFTLYGVWEIKTFTITYKGNPVLSPPSPQTKTYGQSITLAGKMSRPGGYVFVGWSEDKNAKTAEYQAGATFTKNADTTLYAIWAEEVYTVTFDANGGTRVPKDRVKVKGEALALSFESNEIPLKDGYTCLGWATSKEEAAAKQVRYFLISTEYLDIDSDITLYAVWDKNHFTDVNPKGWAGKYIAYINYRKVMTGFSKTEFGVNNNLIRADMVTLIYKLEGKPMPESSKSPFEDVENGKYYTEPICWAKENSIVNGKTATTFCPTECISRQDFVLILYRYAGTYKGYDVSVADANAYRQVEDHAEVARYAREAVNWGYSVGLVGQGSLLKPTANITRAEAATIMARFLQLYAK